MNLPVDSLPKTEIVRPVKQRLRTAAWPLARSGADPERPRPARDEREADFSIKKSGGSGMPPPLRLVRPTSRFRTSFKFGLAAALFCRSSAARSRWTSRPHVTTTTAFSRASATSRAIHTSFTPSGGLRARRLWEAPGSSSWLATAAARGAVAIVNARGALSTVRAGMDGVTVRPLPYAACAFVPRIGPRWRAARPPRGPPL